ncbi:MAG: ABC transporter ATP-binding protein [bacterium JZ-2024 1]
MALVLVINGLRRSFGSRVVLKGVSFRVEPGEIFGYLGPNGSGKTTTLRIMTGMLKPDAGEVQIAGIDLAKDPLAVKRRIGYVPESGALYEHLTPREFFEFLGAIYEIEPDALRRRATELMDLFQLSAEWENPMSGFSRGMKQKVLIISALLHNPDVLLLDEPLNALDVRAVLAVKDLLKALAEDGKTILYSSHLLEIVERMCHTVGILHDGVLKAVGSVKDILKGGAQKTLEDVFRQITGEAEDPEHIRQIALAIEK